jgi:hypothetical protein
LDDNPDDDPSGAPVDWWVSTGNPPAGNHYLDLMTTIVHELGHALGASHNDTSGYVMVTNQLRGLRSSVLNTHELDDWNDSFDAHAP